MKHMSYSVVGLLISILATGIALSQAPTGVVADPSLRAFLPQFEDGTSRFINGDPTLWKKNTSKRDDATIMGAWGGYEKGWNEVGARYDWVSTRLKETSAKVNVTYISSGVSGDLAYAVAIERSEVQRLDQDKPVPTVLRVTHVFRKEDGAWKLVHRHADPLIETTAPSTVRPK